MENAWKEYQEKNKERFILLLQYNFKPYHVRNIDRKRELNYEALHTSNANSRRQAL